MGGTSGVSPSALVTRVLLIVSGVVHAVLYLGFVFLLLILLNGLPSNEPVWLLVGIFAALTTAGAAAILQTVLANQVSLRLVVIAVVLAAADSWVAYNSGAIVEVVAIAGVVLQCALAAMSFFARQPALEQLQ